MEPRIQYAKTEDGVSIAYRTFGEGEPALVWLHGLASDLRWESIHRLCGLAPQK